MSAFRTTSHSVLGRRAAVRGEPRRASAHAAAGGDDGGEGGGGGRGGAALVEGVGPALDAALPVGALVDGAGDVVRDGIEDEVVEGDQHDLGGAGGEIGGRGDHRALDVGQRL